MLLVVNSRDIDGEKIIMDTVKLYSKHNTVKSRNMTKNSLDLIVELRTDKGSQLIRELLNLDEVETASLMSHDGETTF